MPVVEVGEQSHRAVTVASVGIRERGPMSGEHGRAGRTHGGLGMGGASHESPVPCDGLGLGWGTHQRVGEGPTARKRRGGGRGENLAPPGGRGARRPGGARALAGRGTCAARAWRGVGVASWHGSCIMQSSCHSSLALARACVWDGWHEPCMGQRTGPMAPPSSWQLARILHVCHHDTPSVRPSSGLRPATPATGAHAAPRSATLSSCYSVAHPRSAS